MTARELIAEAEACVAGGDFDRAEALYLRAWGLVEKARQELEAARREADRDAERACLIVETGFLVAGVALSLSLMWWPL